MNVNFRSVEQSKNGQCYGWFGGDSQQCCEVLKSKRRKDGTKSSLLWYVVSQSVVSYYFMEGCCPLAPFANNHATCFKQV